MNKHRDDVGIIMQSLSQRSEKEQKSTIIRQKYLHELACLIFEESNRDGNSLLSLCDAFTDTLSNRNILQQQDDMLFLIEVLSQMLCQKKNHDLTYFSLEGAEMPKRLAYVKNMFSDSAFRCFDKKLGPLRCEYCDSFDFAASGVFFGQFDGCILPFESTHGNIMAGVMNTVNKYCLKKALECNIPMPEDEKVKFGIFARDLVLNDKNDRLDVLLEETDLFALSELAIISKKLGTTSGICHRIMLSGENKILLSLKGNKASQFKLMLYMTLSGIRYDITGSYQEII